MSEPTSAPDQNATPAVPPVPTPDGVPAVPPAPTFSYGSTTPAPGAAPVAPPTYGAPGYASPAYGAPPAAPRRTWDIVLTIILLVLGLIGMIAGVGYGLIFLAPDLLAEALAQSGYGRPTIDTRGPGTLIIASHVILYLLAIGVGILLLVKRKVAFWVPLAAGVIATFLFWFVAGQVFLSIPNFGA